VHAGATAHIVRGGPWLVPLRALSVGGAQRQPTRLAAAWWTQCFLTESVAQPR